MQGSRTKYSQGYAMLMAFLFGLVVIPLMTLSLLAAQNNRASSTLRRETADSSIVADSAIALVLVELAKPENNGLLVRNYDPINPETGKTYLGEDGTVNSGEEGTTAVDEWTGYDPSAKSCYQAFGISAPDINLSGTIGANDSYRILAYRYNPDTSTGTVLIEGESLGGKTYMAVSISIQIDLDNFPGIGLNKIAGWDTGVLALRGREILGKNGNVYFTSSESEPGLTGVAQPNDADRPQFRNAIWSSNLDGSPNDTVSGSIVGCDLNINVPSGTKGTNHGVIDTTTTFTGNKWGPLLYQLEGIDLAGDETLTIDTTDGPVIIHMIFNGDKGGPGITLRDTAKIINTRRDGQPPQVGDVRIFMDGDNRVDLYGRSCIHQVFLYSFLDELRLHTEGPGCPGGQNTNFEGVVWAEAVLSSKNDVSNRNVEYLGSDHQSYDTLITPGATSGIAVPDDVSSLMDLLQHTDFPIRYRYRDVLSWQKVSLR